MLEPLVDARNQPIRNLAQNPSLAVNQSSWGQAGNVTFDLSNTGRRAATGSRTGYVMRLATQADGNTLYCYAGRGTYPMSPGKKATVLLRARQIAGTLKPLHARIVPRTAGDVGLGDILGTSVTPTALGQWVWLRVTGTMPATTAYLQAQGRCQPGGVGVIAGDIFEFDSCMVVEGDYTGEYCDGDTLNWRWTGASGQSESVGYPYTVESLASGFLAMRSTAGDSTFSIGAFDGRTLYAVYDADGTLSGNFTIVAMHGVVSSNLALTGGTHIDASGTGVATMRSRTDTRNGALNHTLLQPGTGRAAGRHIGWSAVRDGLVYRSFAIDKADAHAGGALTTLGEGMPDGILRLRTPADDITPIAAVAFKGEHDAATRARVLAWLANKYGVTLS